MINKLKHLKHVRILLLIAFVGINKLGSTQYMEFEWSDKYRFTNKKTGFFSEYIGTSHTSIYLLQRNISKSKPYDNAKLMLVALNKNTVAHDTMIPLKGFPENKSAEKTLNSLDYLTSIVSEEQVIVFWRKLINTDSTRKEEIYAQTFKSNLKKGLSLKKVFETTQEVESQESIFDPSMCVVISEEESEHFVIGTEYFKNGEIKFQYITLNYELSPSILKTISLPQKLINNPKQITSTYDLLRNGHLCIRSSVKYTNKELDELPLKHSKSFLSLTVANIKTAEHCVVKMQCENKTITDYSYENVGDRTRVIGFFGDLSKDTTGIDKQGLFYADIDNLTLSKTDVKFVYFDRSTVNRLFPKKRMKKRMKESPSQEEILQTRFDIEHIEVMPDSSIVLFSTLEYNQDIKSSRSNMKGENVYATNSFFKKRDIDAIRFSNDGEIMWARSLERKAKYEGVDLMDVRVVYKYNKFIVIYGNDDAELKPPKQKKKYKHLTEELEYATFDPKSGRAKTYTTPVNEPKTDKKDKRYLDPNSAVVIDDKFYFHKMTVCQNPLWTAANVVCFPTIYYSVLSGNTKLGKGDFTMMRIMEGKRPRRKK